MYKGLSAKEKDCPEKPRSTKMPPKKARGNQGATKEDNTKAEPETKKEIPKAAPQKRKQAPQSQTGPEKAPRRSGRGASKPSSQQTLRFLLSPDAINLCRSQDETKDLEKNDGSPIKTYAASELSPFEELLSAVVFSRPISHHLGARTVRTILNPPYTFTTPKAIQEAGDEKRLQALWDARTQHKDKTALQLREMADVVAETFSGGDAGDGSLEGLRKAAGYDMERERDLLTSSIKGLGKTGTSIFFRRVQWLWPECYPYVDDRTEMALDELGLPKDAEGLQELLDESWDAIGKEVGAGKDEEVRKRRAFVIVLERATGAQLESNVSQVLDRAGKA